MATNEQTRALTYFRSGGYITLNNGYAREQLRRLLDAHALLVEPLKSFVPRLVDDYEYLLIQQTLNDIGVNPLSGDGANMLDILARVPIKYRNERERGLLTTILNPIPTNETVLFRVNAGGNTELSTPDWEDDNPGPISYVSGTTQRASNALDWTFNANVPAYAQIQGLGRNERASTTAGGMDWTFDLTGYEYAIVNVFVGETFWTVPASGGDGRSFNAAINGVALFTELDLFSTYGRGQMVLYQRTVQPNGSDEIVVSFTPGAEDNPIVLALEIIGLS